MEDNILQKRVWKLENVINVLNGIVINMKLVSQEAGIRGRGLTASTAETQKFMYILEKEILFPLKFDNVKFEKVSKKMESIGEVFWLLGIGTMLEAKRSGQMKAFILADEVIKIGDALKNNFESSQFRKNLTMLHPDPGFKEPLPFVIFNIAGSMWAENMNSVFEIMKVKSDMLQEYPQGSGKMKHQISARGMKFPVVNIHTEMGADLELNDTVYIAILNLGHILFGHTSSDMFFGLIVDDVEYAGFLNKGISENDYPSDIPSHYIRYLWKTKDASLMFFNWDNIINEHEIREYKQIEMRKI